MSRAWRDEFPITTRCVYFDHAGVAPVSRRVADAVERFVADARDFGRLHYRAWEERGEAVRVAAGALVGAAGDEIAFVSSTSDGLSAIATGLDWRPGDSVVTVADEFPANVYPWWGLAALGVETRMAPVERGRLTVDAVARLIDATTRVVSVSAVDFATGQRRPLAAIGELCRARGVLFCVDAIQALGAVRVDVERDGIDCLAADGHKWLCAPEGCGILYVSRRWWDRLTPRRVGWKSVTDHGRYLPYHFALKANALKFECGSLNFLGIYALGAAVDLLLEVGLAVVEERVLALTGELRDALKAHDLAVVSPDGEGERSGIVTARVPCEPTEVVAVLREAGVLASPRGGGVRFSPHFYCDETDVARCVAAVATAISR
jgi:selenocysteine lyase/cysteine desulfurase